MNVPLFLSHGFGNVKYAEMAGEAGEGEGEGETELLGLRLEDGEIEADGDREAARAVGICRITVFRYSGLPVFRISHRLDLRAVQVRLALRRANLGCGSGVLQAASRAWRSSATLV